MSKSPESQRQDQTSTSGIRHSCPHHYRNSECRNLVICVDGTGNKFGKMNTNVIELYNLILKKSGDNQLCWYNSGVGTYAGESGSIKTLKYAIDLAIAMSVKDTVLAAYRWLSDNYKEGDCIFLFGFSRGAYQVRVLSAMIEKVGLIHKGNDMQIPFAYEIYANHKTGVPDEKLTTIGSTKKEDDNTTMAARFKGAFSHDDVKIHFVGAWDTVSSVGLVRPNQLLPGTTDGMKHVCYFRHALALDERRVKFLPEYAYGGSSKPPANATGHRHSTPSLASSISSFFSRRRQSSRLFPAKNDLRSDDASTQTSDDSVELDSGLPPPDGRPQTLEVWFAGTHSDIGGGNVVNAGMNRGRPPLRWMIFEAGALGLRTLPFKRNLSSEEDIVVKESLSRAWKILEYLPIRRLTYTTKSDGRNETRWPHRGTGRKIVEGQKIHSSLFFTEKLGGEYIPKARPPFSNEKWKELMALDTLKDWVYLDVHGYIEVLYEMHLMDRKDSLNTLQQMSAWRDGKQAIYDVAVNCMKKQCISKTIITSNNGLSVRLIDLVLSLLKTSSHLLLYESSYLREMLSDLLKDEDTQRKGLEFRLLLGLPPEPAILGKHKDWAFSLAFFMDGKRLVSGSDDKRILIWDVHKGRQEGITVIEHTKGVRAVAVSPDGKYVLSGSDDDTIEVWDAENNISIGPPCTVYSDGINSVAFSPDGRRAVLGAEDGTVRLWDIEAEQQIGNPCLRHQRRVWSVAFSSDGVFVASGSADGTLRLWNVKTGKEVGDPFSVHDDPVYSVSFSPNGNLVACGLGDNTIRLYDLVENRPIDQPLCGHEDKVNSVSFSPDGALLVSGSDDFTLRIWDVMRAEQVGEPLEGHKNNVSCVRFSPDGKTVASASWDATIRMWNVEDYIDYVSLFSSHETMSLST